MTLKNEMTIKNSKSKQLENLRCIRIMNTCLQPMLFKLHKRHQIWFDAVVIWKALLLFSYY